MSSISAGWVMTSSQYKGLDKFVHYIIGDAVLEYDNCQTVLRPDIIAKNAGINEDEARTIISRFIRDGALVIISPKTKDKPAVVKFIMEEDS